MRGGAIKDPHPPLGDKRGYPLLSGFAGTLIGYTVYPLGKKSRICSSNDVPVV